MKNDLPINQEVSGNGPPLVILHGLFGDADNFRSVAAPLEEHYQIIRLDLPGHGKSSSLPSLTIDALADAVNQHLTDTGIDRYYLLGHSLGGKVAMQMAGNAASTNIQKLLVIDIAPRLYPPHHVQILDALQALSFSDVKTRGDVEKQLSEGIPEVGVRRFLLKSLYRNDAGEFGWRFDLQGIRTSYEAIRQPPSFAHMVSAPTLFIKGGNSDYLGPEDEAPIRANFKSPNFKVIADTGHWLHAEKPALFARLCLEFLQQDENSL